MKTIINKIFEKEQHKNIEKKIAKIHNNYFDGLAPNLEDFEQLVIERTLLELKSYMKHDFPYWKHKTNLY
tara:strand:+ start:878 stop:1087 length:210 start_codon:yes stop_codon:yes gene_type:complete